MKHASSPFLDDILALGKSSQLSLSFPSYEMGSGGDRIAWSIKYLPLVKAGLGDTADRCGEEIGSSCPVLTLNRSQWTTCVSSSLPSVWPTGK